MTDKAPLIVPNGKDDNDDLLSIVKVAVGGDAGVGKTSLLSRLQKNEFSEHVESTIGFGIIVHTVNHSIKYQIWDASGQERFKGLFRSTVKFANLYIFVYDVGDYDSFLGVASWIKELGWDQTNPKTIGYLFGNKTDLKARAVSAEEGEVYAMRERLHYAEMSAKTGFNIGETFLQITQHVLQLEKVIRHQSGGKETIFLSPAAPLMPHGTAHSYVMGVGGIDDDVEHKSGCCACLRRKKKPNF